jgi:hypothetical protein
MKQSYITDEKELFPGSDVVRKYTFKTMRLGDSYVNLAVILPILAALVGLLRGKSALFQVRGWSFASQTARPSNPDCFECLSPTLNAA